MPAAAPGFTVAVIVPALKPKLTPLLLLNTMVPVLCEPPAALIAAPPPAPGSAADRDSVSPAELLAVVPLRLVRASVGLPCEWLDCAAVVRKAGKLRDRPELLAVTETPFAVSALLSPIASFDARAVVKPLWLAVIVEALNPNVTPLALPKLIAPVLPCTATVLCVCTDCAGTIADKLRVSPALLLAVVPLMFVSASVGLPCECPDCAAVVRY